MDHEREHDVLLDDVESEFWSRIPDRRFARRPSQPGSRVHHDDTGPVAVPRPITQSIPVVTEALSGTVRQATRHIDPLIRRLGVAAVLTALAVPVALSLRADDQAAVISPQVAADDGTTATTPTTSPATAAAPANPWAAIDVDALPAAVPVNPDPATTAEEPASSATPATEAAASSTAGSSTTAAQPEARTEAAAPACGPTYTVQAGDAWLLIADRANVSLRALLGVNGASTSTALYPGRSICLPVGATVPRKVSNSSASGSSSGGSSSGGSSAGGNSAPATTAPKPPTTTAPPPAASYSRSQVERIIRDVWPDHLEDKAVAIAVRESNLSPTARNFCCHGLFQIYFNVHRSWLDNIGVTSASQLYDPRTNAFAAYVLYLRSGSFAPWGG